MRTMHRVERALLALLCLAAALLPAALPSARAEEEAAATLLTGVLTEVELSNAPARFRFSPHADGTFSAYLFPLEESVSASAELWRGDALLAAGDALPWMLMHALEGGETYELRLTGCGRARLEVTREVQGRTYNQPHSLEKDYAKVIARPGDAHWYSLELEGDAPVALLGLPRQQELELKAQLFSAAGRLLEEAQETPGGAALLTLSPEAGRRFLLRVCAREDLTGQYALRLTTGGEAAPEAVDVSPAKVTLTGRERATLAAALSPSGTSDALYWESSDPTVVLVSQEGEITGLRPGNVDVTAYTAGGLSARCAVTVKNVQVRRIGFPRDVLELHAGDESPIQVGIDPANALNQLLSFQSADVGVVEIEGGVLYARTEGETTVTARSLDSGVTAQLKVIVGPAVRHYRALLVGELNYASTVASSRPGTLNSLNSLRSMLESQSYDGACFQLAPPLLDAGRDTVLAAIRSTFEKATDADLSLLYLTCHGSYADGMTRFQMVDGSIITADELARTLRRVKGEVLVLLDCCGSGGAIGAGSDTDDILSGIGAVFGGMAGDAPLAQSRFRVLASAAQEQDSFRIRYSLPSGDAVTSTVFARALCEAGGWDMSADTRAALRADRDYDDTVNMSELYGYLRRRVAWILSQNNTHREDGLPVSAQSVRLWPETDAAPVFARTGEIEKAEAFDGASEAME